jgi:cyclohexa-1,5-dienecarbonyl-CoA hydratase
MAADQFIKLDQDQGVARITLDRPRHNVFNLEMIGQFNDVLQELSPDRDLKGIVLRGAGASWCAGVDVGDHKPEVVDGMIAAFSRSFELLHALEVPIIAAVHGACLGGGMEYAIACDIILAARGANFGQPEVRLGFLPPYAAIRLPQLVGEAKAIEICTTGGVYSAEEALALGFVSRVVADDAFEGALAKLTGELQASSPLILRLNKQAVKDNRGRSFKDALASVDDLFLDRLMKTEDTLEGIASFYEKRKPQGKNR